MIVYLIIWNFDFKLEYENSVKKSNVWNAEKHCVSMRFLLYAIHTCQQFHHMKTHNTIPADNTKYICVGHSNSIQQYMDIVFITM